MLTDENLNTNAPSGDGTDISPAYAPHEAAEDILSRDMPQGASWLDNLLSFAETRKAEESAEAAEDALIDGAAVFPAVADIVLPDETPDGIEDVSEADVGNEIEDITPEEVSALLQAQEPPEEAEPELDEDLEHFLTTGELPPEHGADDAQGAEGEDADADVPSEADEGAESEAEEEYAAAEEAADDASVPDDPLADGPPALSFPTAEPASAPESGDTAPGKESSSKKFNIATDYRHDFGDYDRIHPVKLDKHHRTGCLGGVLYFLFVLIMGALLACVLWLAAVDVLAINKPDSDITITVPEEFTVEEVTDILYEQGLIRYKPLFKLFAKFSHAENKIESGVYNLKTNYDYRALVSCMSASSGMRVETEVTIPEGYNLFQIFSLLEEEQVCTAEDLWEASENGDFDYDFLTGIPTGGKLRLEGYLFPDTYKFYINDDAERVINKMLRNFDAKLTEEYLARAEELGMSLDDVIRVASLVEKEAALNSERAAIASVIYNRLNNDDFPNLQIDATFYYSAYVLDAEPSPSLVEPHNTYVITGLPRPITNPGIASIRAALYPETTNYYYYAATTDNTTRFFTNYKDFEKFIESDDFKRD